MKPASPALKVARGALAATGLGLALAAVNPVAVPRLPQAQAQTQAEATNPCAAARNPCAAAKPTVLPAAAAAPFDVAARAPQAPFGDRMPAIVKNYLRAAPYIGTGGIVAEGAYPQLKELGFKTVVNMLTAEEGGPREAAAARAAGIAYIDMPVATTAPTPDQVAAFAGIVSDSANYPILVHCQSANRVGAMWALYRAGLGVPAEIAIQEGRTIGLRPSREGAVREMLGLPAMN